MKADNIKNSSQKVRYSFLKILTDSDLSRRRLPFMAVESVNSGPVVWLTGCIHGDEVTGIVTIQEVFKTIRKQPLLKGSLYAFQLMNPIGFETASRNITLSKKDLNRSFPGDLVKKDRAVAKIYNAFGKLQDTLLCRRDGVVLGHSDFSGAPVMAFGVF